MAAVALCPTVPAPQVAASMASPRLAGIEDQLATIMALLTGFMAQVKRQHESLLERAAAVESSSCGYSDRLSRLEQELFGKAAEGRPAAPDERPVPDDKAEEHGVEVEQLDPMPQLDAATAEQAVGELHAQLLASEAAAEEVSQGLEDAQGAPEDQQSPSFVGESVEAIAGAAAPEQPSVVEGMATSEAPEVAPTQPSQPPSAAEGGAAAEAEPVAAEAPAVPEAAAPATASSPRRPERPVPQVLEIEVGVEEESSMSSAQRRDYENDIDLHGGKGARFRDGRLTVRIAELPLADGVNGSTGHQIWPGSVVLASELLRRPELVAGKRVLEMGSGCALVGITAAHMARYTLMTDWDEEVVTNVQKNLRLNAQSWLPKEGEPQRRVATCQLDWTHVPKHGWSEEDRFDTILAAEVIYGNWGDKVARAMVEMLVPNGTMIMSVSEDRRGSIGAFKEQLFMSGFKVLETKILAPAGTVRVYECTKRQGDEERFTFAERDDSAQESPWRSMRTSEPSIDSTDAKGQLRRGSTPLKVGAVDARHSRPPPPPPPPASLGARDATSFKASSASKAQHRRTWKVVGGTEKGIIVRDGGDGMKSAYLGRLDHGALVEEVQRIDKRIEYKLYKGSGPPEGWVTLVSAKGARLLVEYDG